MSTELLPRAVPVERVRPDRVASASFWAALTVASALPQIVVTELTGHAPWLLAVTQLLALLVLLALTRRLARLRVIESPLRWLVGMAAGWHLVVGGVTGSDAWARWQHSVPWVARGGVVQALVFVPTLLLMALGPGRLGHAALRLRAGDGEVRAGAGLYTGGTHPAWRRLGTFWALGITAGTATAMWFAVGAKAGDLTVLGWSLPFVAVLAAVNTLNEEFGYRNVPLAVLPPLVGRRGALVATSLLFGLAHFYGNPPGASGVLLAAFLGALLAKSMIETGGSRWAWIIHWLQDLVIFSFLTLAWADL